MDRSGSDFPRQSFTDASLRVDSVAAPRRARRERSPLALATGVPRTRCPSPPDRPPGARTEMWAPARPVSARATQPRARSKRVSERRLQETTPYDTLYNPQDSCDHRLGYGRRTDALLGRGSRNRDRRGEFRFRPAPPRRVRHDRRDAGSATNRDLGRGWTAAQDPGDSDAQLLRRVTAVHRGPRWQLGDALRNSGEPNPVCGRLVGRIGQSTFEVGFGLSDHGPGFRRSGARRAGFEFNEQLGVVYGSRRATTQPRRKRIQRASAPSCRSGPSVEASRVPRSSATASGAR